LSGNPQKPGDRQGRHFPHGASAIVPRNVYSHGVFIGVKRESIVDNRLRNTVIALLMFLYGCRQSIFMNMVNAIPFLDVSPERSSKATSLHGTVLQFSMSLGISLAALLLDASLESRQLTRGCFQPVLPLARP
jgi:hypothetical protein